VAFIQKEELSLVSIFPQQIMKTTGEWITVPLMNWILLGLLPLRLVRTSSFPSLSAANGQFMLFPGPQYRVNQWHEKVKTEAVEDILISRMIKQRGLKMVVLLGDHDVFCRMYNSWREAIYGFSKNTPQFFGGNRIGMVIFAFLTVTGFIPVLLTGKPGIIISYILSVVLIKGISSAISRQSVIKNIIFHLLQMLTFGLLAITSVYYSFSGSYTWKNRKINIKS
jgi:hypothetical protein